MNKPPVRALGKRTSAFLRAYYKGPDHPLKMRLWRWFRLWTGWPRLTVSYGKRSWITVDESDYIGMEILTKGSFELEVWQTLAEAASSNEVFWDVGAHIGCFTLLALEDPRVQEVHAFEPNPVQAALLSKHTILNQGKCTVHPFALSDQEETRQLHGGPDSNTGQASFIYRKGTGAFEAQCQTVDRLVFQEKLPAPTLMKIDTEGWERHVLEGAKRVLSEYPPKAIVFEAESDGAGTLQDKAIKVHLESRGYEIRWLRRLGGDLQELENFVALYEPKG